MPRVTHENAHVAIREGIAAAPCGIAYIPAKGWRVYDLRHGFDPSVGTPEFLCLAPGYLPIALCADGEEILARLPVPAFGELPEHPVADSFGGVNAVVMMFNKLVLESKS